MKQEDHKVIDLTLGSAMWGWTIPEKRCFELLDAFYAAGFRQIDTATNYPINKIPKDFRKSEIILQNWIKTNGIRDLAVTVKVGSINNLRTPDQNLSKSFLLINLDDYRALYGENFDMLMLHWDNRDYVAEIQQTLEALDETRKLGVHVGLSGIRYPELYADLNKNFQLDFYIQCKHNLLQSDYERYKPFHGSRRFITYGINAGGIKLNADEYSTTSSLQARGGNVEGMHPIVAPLRQIIAEANQVNNRPAINNMNQCGMIFAYYAPDVSSILTGPSSVEQLENTIDFFEKMHQFDYKNFYQQLQKIGPH